MDSEAKTDDPRAEFHVYQDKQSLWRWRLVSPNGRIISDSAESYISEGNVRRAIKKVIELIKEADISESNQ